MTFVDIVRRTALPICGNIAVSVCLIITNKALMRRPGFDFTMTLTLLHFFCTGLTMRILALAGVFSPKHVPHKTMGLFALSGVGSILFNNLTLQYNSVGFYQLMKLCCVPATVAVESFLFGKRFSAMVLMSLVILLVGISGATITDVEFNWLGFFFGVISVAFTTWYQIWIGTIQTTFELSQFQLLHAVTPWWTGMALVVALQVDVFSRSADHSLATLVASFDPNLILLLIGSCSFAVGVNFSGFLLINVTSALTYMVVGHTKTLLILSSAFVLFDSPITAANMLSILVAFVGVCMYGYYKSLPASTKPAGMEMVRTSDEDIDAENANDEDEEAAVGK